MAPVATSPSQRTSSSVKRSAPTTAPRKKRARTSYASAPHPYGLKPLANALLTPSTLRQTSLGHFATLHDDLLLHLLATLPPRLLARLSCASRALYAYASYEALWRDALLGETKGEVSRWCGSWRRTYAFQLGNAVLASPSAPPQVRGLYSDVLHTPWRLTQAPLNLSSTHQGSLARLPPSTTRDFFEAEYAGRKPAILTDAARAWTAMGWTLDTLVQRCGARKLQAEAMRCTAGTYRDYAREQARAVKQAEEAYTVPDESPLYLFDAALPALIDSEWSVPTLLSASSSTSSNNDATSSVSASHDLFSLLGSTRPDYRWLIAGPALSGSGWHKDPNSTSAWNGVLSGLKYWLFLPPDVVPPGVYVSKDEGEVTAPLSIAEWCEGYLERTRELHGDGEGDGKLMEGVCKAGDVAYVPAGWWHLVVNLEESVAFTQNLISRFELSGVLDFMQHKPEQVSGFKPSSNSSTGALAAAAGEGVDCDDEAAPREVYDLFCAKLRAYDAELLECALAAIQKGNGTTARGEEKREKREAWWTRMKAAESSDVAQGESAGFALALDEEELDEVPW